MPRGMAKNKTKQNKNKQTTSCSSWWCSEDPELKELGFRGGPASVHAPDTITVAVARASIIFGC